MSKSENFKLLALRPLKLCSKRYSKNLVKGRIYKFYNDYKFLNKLNQEVGLEEEVSHVVHDATNSINLYSIKVSDSKTISVNVSAIVGKNGSGKSTLLELLYASCFVIASHDDVLHGSEYLKSQVQKYEKHVENYRWYKFELQELENIYTDLHVEVYYCDGNNIFKVVINGDAIIYHSIVSILDSKSSTSRVSFSQKDSFKVELCKNFFYTIAVNYSIYGLNELHTGFWLSSLFHKNDAYQTPIVINPFRKKGVIDINSEYNLAQTRVLANLLDNTFKETEGVFGRTVESLEFKVFPYSMYDFSGILYRNIFDTHEKKNNETVVTLFQKILMKFYDYSIPQKTIEKLNNTLIDDLKGTIDTDSKKTSTYHKLFEKDHLEPETLLYLILKYTIKKVFRICQHYNDYKKFKVIISEKKPIPYLINVDELLNKLVIDESHITLKLRQILNTVRFSIFLKKSDSINWKKAEDIFNKDNLYFSYIINYQQFKTRLKNLNFFGSRNEELVPGAFFKPDFYFDKDVSKYKFSLFSSGEQQIVHSIQSILYHISNVNSVFRSKNDEKITYKRINIVLDEVELYYHPEYQRSYVERLLKGLENLFIENIDGINILFSTHSPFILSDIIHRNILKLENGDSKEFNEKEKTLGANIHDLLANDFFLEEGYMGKFAMNKIKSLIQYLEYDENDNFWDKELAKKFIDVVGEPLIRNSLKDIYFSRFNNDIDEEIKRLRQLKSKG